MRSTRPGGQPNWHSRSVPPTSSILANHGVIATGRNLAEAVYRAVSIERVCRLAYDVMAAGRTPTKMSRGDMVGMRASLIERAADVYWAGAARITIKADRSVLT